MRSTKEAAAIQLEVKKLIREDVGIIKATVTENKTYALAAAKNTVGDVVLSQLTKLVSAKVPFYAKGYVASPVGQLLLANALNAGIKQYAASNGKALYVADAVMSSAYVSTAKTLDIPGLIDELIAGIELPDFGNTES